ncbi:helix-turn-helix transcriptional regulator [Streptomyces sp. NPDC055721]|uniref:helix-turn-helix transcriptional regulator n=1 Tax=Streptomyces sp. NPDC127132 TaxID=3345374 RepID=UPI003633DBEB
MDSAQGSTRTCGRPAFRTEIGETPARYRTRLRMERARLLLAETDLPICRSAVLPITVIAMDLGYSSSQHFATAFRRETDTTPSRYRSAVRGSCPSREHRRPSRVYSGHWPDT